VPKSENDANHLHGKRHKKKQIIQGSASLQWYAKQIRNKILHRSFYHQEYLKIFFLSDCYHVVLEILEADNHVIFNLFMMIYLFDI